MTPAHNRQAITAAAWGFAEATFFFIVPDVYLSRLALRGRRAAFLCCLWAALAALPGGLILFACGRMSPDAGLTFLDFIPGISPALIESSENLMREHGLSALFYGALGGKPYKIFALLAGSMHLSPALFLGVSFAARLARFTAATAVAAMVAWFLRNSTDRLKNRLHAMVWTGFYAYYFARFGL